MTQISPKVALHGTRLVHFLSDLAIEDSAFSRKNFAERLGRLIDFSDSMKLSEIHEKLDKWTFEPAPTPVETLREDVIRVRMLLVQSIVTSLVPAVEFAHMKLPSVNAGLTLDKLVTFDPYHRIYASHQREFEYKIKGLQLRVRDAVSGVSPDLAKLAALDEAVRDILSAHTLKYLAVIPRLLGKRFDYLLQEYKSLQDESDPQSNDSQPDEEIMKMWIQPNGWLGKFLGEMQGLLLAELELRLLPVLGLIEAVNEQAGKK